MKPCRVALSGKGGTGKTTVSALLVHSLISAGASPVLAVDADPNANLHEALGVEVKESLGCMREEAFTKSIPPGMARTEYIKYRFRQVLVESEGFDLMAMGRPEGTGCYCFANTLLSECMGLLEEEYRFIVMDMEAGMEHVSRGTVGRPDILLIVSDPGARGIRTAQRLQEIARSVGITDEKIFLVFNRFKSETAPVPPGLPQPIGWIPEDPAVENADLSGLPVGDISADSPARIAVQEIARLLIEQCSRQKPA
jgi:CO dehydrogenase maturation factor